MLLRKDRVGQKNIYEVMDAKYATKMMVTMMGSLSIERINSDILLYWKEITGAVSGFYYNRIKRYFLQIEDLMISLA